MMNLDRVGTEVVFGREAQNLVLPASGPYLELATRIAAGWFAANPCAKEEIGEIVSAICEQLIDLDFSRVARLDALRRSRDGLVDPLDAGRRPSGEDLRSAVPVEESLTDDYIICLEDGRRLRMLKRYLAAQYGMSPNEYRLKWGLPADYPMSCGSVSAQRAAVARAKGLGLRNSKAGQVVGKKEGK